MKRVFSLLLALLFVLSAFPVHAMADDEVRCPRCGNDVPDYSNFCLYCGCPLRPTGDPELTLESETGKAELVGLAPVPDGFLSDETLDPADFIMVLVRYTNYSEDERDFQDEFWLRAYQNGVELSDSFGRYRKGTCPEYDNFYTHLLQNGSITLARVFRLQDATDVTAIVSFNGSSSKEKAKATFSMNGEAAEPAGSAEANDEDRSAMLEQYAPVFDALNGGTWYFGSGDNTILNQIVFTPDTASIAQVYFDGNGRHDNGSRDYPYRIDDSAVTVTLVDGSEFSIPYTLEEDGIRLGENDFFTLEEIDEALQGYWTVRSSFEGYESEYNILIDHGNLKSESASESRVDNDGSYFWYGPYEGKYTLIFGGFDTEMRHGSSWFFSIVDGQPVLLHYDSVCSRSDGLPGQNGYSFG